MGEQAAEPQPRRLRLFAPGTTIALGRKHASTCAATSTSSWAEQYYHFSDAAVPVPDVDSGGARRCLQLAHRHAGGAGYRWYWWRKWYRWCRRRRTLHQRYRLPIGTVLPRLLAHLSQLLQQLHRHPGHLPPRLLAGPVHLRRRYRLPRLGALLRGCLRRGQSGCRYLSA